MRTQYLILLYFCCTFQSANFYALDTINCDLNKYRDLMVNDYDGTYLRLSGSWLSNMDLHCIAKILQNNSTKKIIQQLRIFDCDIFNVRSSTEILKELGLQNISTIIYRDTSDMSSTYNKKLENNVSADHGASLLILNLKTIVLNVNPFQNYQNLKVLNFDLKTFAEIPKNLFSNLTQLKKLVWQTDYRYVFQRSDIEELPQLESIVVEFFLEEEEACKYFQLNFHNMSNLKEIELKRTFGNCIEESLFNGARNLKKIELTDNEYLKQLPNDLFKDQINLQTLNLQWNSLQNVQNKLFEPLTKLQSLDLSYNKIAKIHWTWPLLPSLKELDVRQYSDILRDLTVMLNTSNFKKIECDECDYDSIKSHGMDALFCESNKSCRFSIDRNGTECPKGCKCHLEREVFDFIIDCNNGGLTELPKLPMPMMGNVTLRIENSYIKMLPNNSFYGYASIANLYASGNNLTSFTFAQIPEKLKFVDLSNNKLTNIDLETVSLLEKRKNLLTIKLADNPWQCNCDLVPLLKLLKTLNNKVFDLDQVKCAFENKTLTLVQVDELYICPSYLYLIVFVVVGLLVIIFLTIILYLCYREPINIWLYEHNCCLWCIIEADLYKDLIYDAFISYSSKDGDILPQFVENLEKCPNPFKLCLHDRDWLVGDFIPDRISLTVEQSKRIIIILSQNFLESTWGRLEFRLAIQATLQEKRRSLIIVLYNEPQNFGCIDNELKAYLQINTYLKWNDPNFWRKLRYAMPHKEPRIRGTRRKEQNNDIEIEYRMS